MGGVLVLLGLVGAVVAWVISAVIAYQKGAANGLKFFFINLGLCIALIGLLFLIIVVPSLNCSGFLCGLGEILIFLLISGLVFLVWPLILIPVVKNRFQNNRSTSFKDADLIDNL